MHAHSLSVWWLLSRAKARMKVCHLTLWPSYSLSSNCYCHNSDAVYLWLGKTVVKAGVHFCVIKASCWTKFVTVLWRCAWNISLQRLKGMACVVTWQWANIFFRMNFVSGDGTFTCNKCSPCTTVKESACFSTLCVKDDLLVCAHRCTFVFKQGSGFHNGGAVTGALTWPTSFSCQVCIEKIYSW